MRRIQLSPIIAIISTGVERKTTFGRNEWPLIDFIYLYNLVLNDKVQKMSIVKTVAKVIPSPTLKLNGW